MATLTDTPSLNAQLAAFQESWAGRVGPEIVEAIRADNAALGASALLDHALREGDAFPAATLPDALGRPVELGALLEAGPLVVSVYRGGWCPYCILELRALQQALPAIRDLGATLVAVSPERPDNALETAGKNDLAFPVLSDTEGKLADALGIRFALSPAIKALYQRFGHDLPSHNGDGRWSLPVPATYVVARGGRIALAHLDTDYRRRLEPTRVLEALSGLA